ncbi:LRRCT [Nesidiocoris tenuis]|uniref:LRRCT n=1 Tax=Nesidiocoris tenuis TaxID=355587 RepID=A0ABN7B5M8_9HEMI|nr:LRRCT [Nesidiocoris tenuis]
MDSKSFAILFVLSLRFTADASHFKDVCRLNACELAEQFVGLDVEEVEQDSIVKRLDYLSRRIRSLEQTRWRLTEHDDRWNLCSAGPCRCMPEIKTLNCWNQGIGIIPWRQYVPVDIRQIDLSNNVINAVHKDTFSGLTKLNSLDISANRIDFLPSLVFESLEGLHHLKLRGNHLEKLSSRLLSRLAFLETLDLSHNRLSSLPAELLKGCRKLLSVNLASNQLVYLAKGFFEGLIKLEEINLSLNALRGLDVDAFKGLTIVRKLKLNQNEITSLTAGIFTDQRELMTLILRKNKLTFIQPGLFDTLPALEFLDLTANHIVELSGTEFHRLDKVVELHLGQNYLKSLPNYTFAGMKSLQRLYLLQNNIVQLSSAAFGHLTSLKTLMLNNNLLREIHPLAFRDLVNLNELQLDSNKLMSIPEKMLSFLTSLTAIKLTKNPWHCDCNILYLSRWVGRHSDKVWPSLPRCLGPGELGGQELHKATFQELCNTTENSTDDYASRRDLGVLAGTVAILTNNSLEQLHVIFHRCCSQRHGRERFEIERHRQSSQHVSREALLTSLDVGMTRNVVYGNVAQLTSYTVNMESLELRSFYRPREDSDKDVANGPSAQMSLACRAGL